MSYLHLVINHGRPIWTPLGLGKLSSQSAGQASLQGLKDTDTQSTPVPAQSGHWFGTWDRAVDEGTRGPRIRKSTAFLPLHQGKSSTVNPVDSQLCPRSVCSWSHLDPVVTIHACGKWPQAEPSLARTLDSACTFTGEQSSIKGSGYLR